MIVALMFVYPGLTARRLVGTDLVQAVPLVGSAALGQALFGHIGFGLTASLLIGSLPAVYLGARISSRASSTRLRPVIAAVLLVSSLKLLDVSNEGLAAALGLAILAVVVLSVLRRPRGRASATLATSE
jgi:uncharacterized membrane protein YfcA